MKKLLLILIVIIADFIAASQLKAQTLPVGSCGIVYTYDPAGNRTKREYVCNNGLVGGNDEAVAENAKISMEDVLKVDVLYPNPTTGIFSVKLFKALNKAVVTISNASGRTLLKKTESGNILTYDLSHYPSGEYFVTIKQDQHSITMKVIKSK
ncbi:T9SS type A sorting domain-containing protein [Parafilimonas sp.]|uniref:T9SS type A sorting domain-containing protein n=1 Tax=Parafilimonas sp. TaxID=1969739 RepID=UPI003F812618